MININNITFIQAGGTIDKDYLATNTNHGYNFTISNPAFKKILTNIEPKFNYEILTATKKDSLDLTDIDRQIIFDTCKKAKYRNIIITHGTDTLKTTAEKLDKIANKIIVLTGAMRPAKFLDSDAEFNLGVAIGTTSCGLNDGVYIAMHGCLFKWQDYE